jgi:hypothetical protein
LTTSNSVMPIKRAAPFAQNGPQRGAEHDRLQVFIGKWINEGYVVDADGNESSRILTSDIYEWIPGRFFVLHEAYGRIGDLDVGATEIIGYDAAAESYVAFLFDSSGGINRSALTANGDAWTWKGETTGCTAVFTDGGTVQTAHHVRLDDSGQWVPSMEVVLRKII